MNEKNRKTLSMTSIHISTRALHKAPTLALCVLASLFVIPTVGCSSTSPRSDSGSSINEINPSIAHARRRHAQALEHYNIATALHLDDKHEEALAEYRKAIELDDKVFAAWNNMGQLLMDQNNYADAASAYQIASGLEPTDPRPEFNIGIAYMELGWAKDAYEHFEIALARNEHYLPALHGAIQSASMLGMGNQEIMGYIRAAQLRETDDKRRAYLSTQYYRVQALLDE